MGKYATYRKRGTSSPAAVPLLPPPPPDLHVDGDDLISVAQGTDDTSGFSRLYRSDVEEGPFSLEAEVAWAAALNWGTTEDLAPGYFRTTELGNGIAYAGQSEPSAIVQLTEP